MFYLSLTHGVQIIASICFFVCVSLVCFLLRNKERGKEVSQFRHSSCDLFPSLSVAFFSFFTSCGSELRHAKFDEELSLISSGFAWACLGTPGQVWTGMCHLGCRPDEPDFIRSFDTRRLNVSSCFFFVCQY